MVLGIDEKYETLSIYVQSQSQKIYQGSSSTTGVQGTEGEMKGCMSENAMFLQWGELCEWECNSRAMTLKKKGKIYVNALFGIY